MKSTLAKFVAVLSVAMVTPQVATAGLSVVNLENGWRALASQTDPFDDTKIELGRLLKLNFTVNCRYFNWKTMENAGFDSYSLKASIKYRIGSDEPVTKDGKFSTYLGGTTLMTDDRYFSFEMTDEDIQNLKAEGGFQLAGQFGGWRTVKSNLKGFATSYDEMCK